MFVIVPANGSRHLDLGLACLYRSACPGRARSGEARKSRAAETWSPPRHDHCPGHRHARKCLLPDACTHSCLPPLRETARFRAGDRRHLDQHSTGRLARPCRRRRFPGTYVSYYALWICMLPSHASVRSSAVHHVRTRPNDAQQRQLLCRPLGVHSDLPSRNSIHPCYERNTTD